MKKIAIPFLLLVFMISVIDDASAQRRGKKKRRKKEDTEETDRKRSRRDTDEDDFGPSNLREKLNGEIKLGNLNFFNNQFSLSLKSNIGYKINKTFSAGVGGKFYYDYINRIGTSDDFHFSSFGGLAYARAKLGSQFYFQGEYSVMNFEFVEGVILRETKVYPSAGIGYMQEGFTWSYGFELLFPINDRVRDIAGIAEYWISFSHNF